MAPPGWVVTQQNAQILITDASQHSFWLDDAQYAMLWALYRDCQYGTDRTCSTQPTESFLRGLKLACLAQLLVDADYAVHWNRHFITCFCLRKLFFCWTRLSLAFAKRGSRGLHNIPTWYGFFACITPPWQPQLISVPSPTWRRDVSR